MIRRHVAETVDGFHYVRHVLRQAPNVSVCLKLGGSDRAHPPPVVSTCFSSSSTFRLSINVHRPPGS